MNRKIYKSLRNLQNYAESNKRPIRNNAEEAILENNESRLLGAIEICRRFYGPPATGEAYISEDKTERYLKLSDGDNDLEGLYLWTSLSLDINVPTFKERQTYLSQASVDLSPLNLRPISIKEYDEMMEKYYAAIMKTDDKILEPLLAAE